MQVSKEIYKILKASNIGGEGHVPSALSILDIVSVIYESVLNLNLIKKNSLHRDYFILSKGHGSLALYVILEKFKLISKKELYKFCDFKGKLGGHPDSTKIKAIESSTGSLGHGLPFGVGVAFAKKIKNYRGKVFVLVGDGECNEGSIYESMLLANHHKLNNLVCIIDDNNSSTRVLNIQNISKKFNSFGWKVINIDGHNKKKIKKSLLFSSSKPLAIIAKTLKGKGVKFMENNPEWHHKKITKDILKQISIINEKAAS